MTIVQFLIKLGPFIDVLTKLIQAGCIQDPNATGGETHEPEGASSEFSVAER